MYISFVFVSIIFLLDYRTVLTVWYFFVFLLDYRTVLTVWYFLFFYWITELFWQCFFVCFSIGLLNCSDSVFLFVFLLDCWTVLSVFLFVFLLDCWTVLTVFFCLFFYWIAELFWQCFFVCFSIGLLNCSDSGIFFSFSFYSPLSLWAWIPLMARCTEHNIIW